MGKQKAFKKQPCAFTTWIKLFTKKKISNMFHANIVHIEGKRYGIKSNVNYGNKSI